MKNGSIRLRKEVVVEEEEEEEEQEEAQGVLIFLEPGPRSPRKVKEKVEEEESDGDEDLSSTSSFLHPTDVSQIMDEGSSFLLNTSMIEHSQSLTRVEEEEESDETEELSQRLGMKLLPNSLTSSTSYSLGLGDSTRTVYGGAREKEISLLAASTASYRDFKDSPVRGLVEREERTPRVGSSGEGRRSEENESGGSGSLGWRDWTGVTNINDIEAPTEVLRNESTMTTDLMNSISSSTSTITRSPPPPLSALRHASKPQQQSEKTPTSRRKFPSTKTDVFSSSATSSPILERKLSTREKLDKAKEERKRRESGLGGTPAKVVIPPPVSVSRNVGGKVEGKVSLEDALAKSVKPNSLLGGKKFVPVVPKARTSVSTATRTSTSRPSIASTSARALPTRLPGSYSSSSISSLASTTTASRLPPRMSTSSSVTNLSRLAPTNSNSSSSRLPSQPRLSTTLSQPHSRISTQQARLSTQPTSTRPSTAKPIVTHPSSTSASGGIGVKTLSTISVPGTGIARLSTRLPLRSVQSDTSAGGSKIGIGRPGLGSARER